MNLEKCQQYPISAGWSADKKSRVVTQAGESLFLRISAPETYDRKAALFSRMEAATALGVPMCRPVSLECREDGVYFFQTWIQGRDAEAVVPQLLPGEQYAYGLDAGRILKKLHTIPAPEDAEDWEVRFNRKMDRKIAGYRDCPLKYENGETFLRYIRENRHLLHGRPQCCQHGDYHIGNMMIEEGGRLTILDFDREDWGDPWEEFNRIVWCAQASPLFASGMVDGYFEGQVPREFWRLLALYISSNALSSLCWAIPFGEGEVAVMRRQAEDILNWYDQMQTDIPAWYCRLNG